MTNTIAASSFPDNEINIKTISFYEAQKVTEVVIFIHFGDKLFTDQS